MFGLGIGELTVTLLLCFVIFGARKLPELEEGLGKGIVSFRQSLKQMNEIETDVQGQTHKQNQND